MRMTFREKYKALLIGQQIATSCKATRQTQFRIQQFPRAWVAFEIQIFALFFCQPACLFILMIVHQRCAS